MSIGPDERKDISTILEPLSIIDHLAFIPIRRVFYTPAGTRLLDHLTAQVQTLGITLQGTSPPHNVLAIHGGGAPDRCHVSRGALTELISSPKVLTGAGCGSGQSDGISYLRRQGLSRTTDPTNPSSPPPPSLTCSRPLLSSLSLLDHTDSSSRSGEKPSFWIAVLAFCAPSDSFPSAFLVCPLRDPLQRDKRRHGTIP